MEDLRGSEGNTEYLKGSYGEQNISEAPVEHRISQRLLWRTEYLKGSYGELWRKVPGGIQNISEAPMENRLSQRLLWRTDYLRGSYGELWRTMENRISEAPVENSISEAPVEHRLSQEAPVEHRISQRLLWRTEYLRGSCGEQNISEAPQRFLWRMGTY